MLKKYSRPFGSIATWILQSLIFLLPLFVLPISLDALEVSKQTLLLLFALLALLALALKSFADERLPLRGGLWNLFPLFVLASAVVSAAFSDGGYRSWIGSSLQQYTSVISFFGYAAVFYLTANALTMPESRVVSHRLLLLSGLIVGAVGLLGLLGFPLVPVAGSASGLSNTIGTLNAFGSYLAVMSVFTLGLFASQPLRRFEKIVGALLLATSLVALMILKFWVLWLLVLVGCLLILFYAFLRGGSYAHSGRLMVPMAIAIVSALFLVFQPSIFSVRIPVEVTPSFTQNTGLVRSAWQETARYFGAGPGMYQFVYARYHDQSVNATGFWNMRFDRAGQFVMTLAVTLGVVGILAWLVLLLAFVAKGARSLAKDPNILAPFVAVVVLAVSFFLYDSNLTLLFLFFVLAGLFTSTSPQQEQARSPARFPRVSRIGAAAGGVLAVFALLAGVFGMFERYTAEVAFAKAVRADRTGIPMLEVSQLLDRAASANRYEDVYFRNLAQSLLLRLGEEISGVKDGVSEEKSKLLQALTGAAVNAAAQATQLGPQNVLNWRLRADVYRELIPFVKDSGSFALASYARAIELEPLHPDHYTQAARTHLALADEAGKLAESSDPKVQQQAKQEQAKHVDDAEMALARALEVKQDFAPAHYQFALLFEREGRVDDAVGKMESVVRYNTRDVGALFQLSLLYLKRAGSGDVERAGSALERAVELAPAFSNARWYLSTVYERQGKFAEAIAQVQKVSELNPDDPNVGSRLKQLEQKKVSAELPAPVGEAPSATR